ncbi:MAG: biotin-dependent carboxyltransferase family protein, partial [Deferribacterales bacterium]
MLKVLDGGLLTTVQDRGRFGYRSYGIPQTGAMDDLAFEIGNILVGNYNNAAVLEFTQLAGSYQFLDERVFCLAGADFNFKLNNNPLETYTTYLSKKGDILSAEYPKEGIRSYLCISGGIDIPMIMNSRSTFLKGEFGGFDGRKIKKGDIIKLFPSIIKNYKKIKFPHWLYIKYDKEIQIVLDKRTFKSSKIDIENLLNLNYNVSINIDRMGVRLEADIALADKTDILTEPTPV